VEQVPAVCDGARFVVASCGVIVLQFDQSWDLRQGGAGRRATCWMHSSVYEIIPAALLEEGCATTSAFSASRLAIEFEAARRDAEMFQHMAGGHQVEPVEGVPEQSWSGR